MEKQEIVTRVIQTVVQVQEESGRVIAGIDASTRPLKDVEGFDSLCGLEATEMLSVSLGIAIPDNRNPFVSEDGNRASSVNEVADALSSFARSEGVAS